jgi:hypothetical protein
MKRASEEQARTLRVWREHRDEHVMHATDGCGIPGVRPEDLVTCVCDNQAGRFRKGQRAHGGCSGFCCKSFKFLKITKKYQRQADISCEEQLDECRHAPHVSLSKFRKVTR